LSKDYRISVKVLRVEKGYDAKKIIAKFPRKNWSISSVSRLSCYMGHFARASVPLPDQ